jgi:hypothetical protein
MLELILALTLAVTPPQNVIARNSLLTDTLIHSVVVTGFSLRQVAESRSGEQRHRRAADPEIGLFDIQNALLCV